MKLANTNCLVATRARTLRSQYNAQIQTMRSRIETRVYRIPEKLRKLKMGDLLAQQTAGTTTQKTTSVPFTNVFRPPAVPQKDYPVAPRPPLQKATSSNASMAPPPSRGQRNNDVVGGDKENEVAQIDMTKKPTRTAGPSVASRAVNPSQVLSPTSSNSRMRPPTERVSPTKSYIARPVSPTKPSVLSNMVEKARSTRAAATTRKTTTMSSVSTTSSTAAPAPAKPARGRKPATATTTSAASRAGAASRAARRVSAISESSDGSTGTVVRKRTTTVAPKPDPPAKRTVMSTIRKGVTSATTKRTAAAKAAPAVAATGTGRVLRKRGP